MNRKGIAPVFLVAGAIVLVIIAMNDPSVQEWVKVANGQFGSIMGVTPHCNADPYNPSCICSEGYNRIYVRSSRSALGADKWYCEPSILMINPDSPDFANDVKGYAQSLFAPCDCDWSCPSYDVSYMGLSITWGQEVSDSSNERVARMECNIATEWDGDKPISGYSKYTTTFGIIDGSFPSSGLDRQYCTEYDGTICMYENGEIIRYEP